MKKENELKEIVNKLEAKASYAHLKFQYMYESLYKSWIEEIKSGNAGIKEARQMLNATKHDNF